jgi:23S rRNA pseudouridine2605 synthase
MRKSKTRPDRPGRFRDLPERGRTHGRSRNAQRYRKPAGPKISTGRKDLNASNEPTGIRLNRFIANAGICSRREADQLIVSGSISINGKIVSQLGTKVFPSDQVRFNDQVIRSEKQVYVLLNKPKGYITSTHDPEERSTVMDLVRKACRERIYPVGRLDRNSTGILLLTNDGELAERLAHPSHQVKKIYEVGLDQPVKPSDIAVIRQGINLDDGFIKADDIAFTSQDKKRIGIEIHSGRNRIVRRIFESLGYKVTRLDRVMYAFLTKKNLPRGKWRHLSPSEISRLKQL